MDILEFIILVLVLCATIFLVYWFFRGAKGNISLARPVESRVDEYLDRRFQSLVEEWDLVTRRRLDAFHDKNDPTLDQDEARISELKAYEAGMQTTLASLEARLDDLEKELGGKGRAER